MFYPKIFVGLLLVSLVGVPAGAADDSPSKDLTDDTLVGDVQVGDQVQVKEPTAAFAVQLVGQSEVVLPWMRPGDTRVEWVDYKNVGTSTWDNTGGVSNPNYMELRSVESPSWPCVLLSSHCAYHSSWINRQRITNVMRNPATGAQKTTNPAGQTARYQFTIEAPSTGSCGQYTVPWATPGCMSNWAYFQVLVDGTAPSVPSITAYPSTNYENSFAFEWDPSYDYEESGVSAYYWKVNGGSENYLPAGQTWVDWGAWATNQGNNTFYVRAVDNVGNSSGFGSVSFFLDSESPTAPGGLTASPSVGYSNSFAFSWNASYDAQSGISGYYWLINGGPESFTTSLSLPLGQYEGVIEGQNSFYVRAEDNLGNSSDYSSIPFYYYRPVIATSVDTVQFFANKNGSLPAINSFTILNTGSGTLTWSISDNAPWLEVSPASGTSNSSSVTLHVNSTSLPEALYVADVSITSANATNSPKHVVVVYDVGPDCQSGHGGFVMIDSVRIDGGVKPPESLYVSHGASLRIYGSGVDPGLDSLLVYDSFRFDSLSSGLFWIDADRCGRFVYPPNEMPAIAATTSGFYPLWFAAGDEATPLLAVVDAGCSTCSLDSVVAALNRDTNNVILSIGTPKSVNDSLSFPILTIPANRSDILSEENDAFLRGYFIKYRGPLGYSFLSNSLGRGWLNRGDSLVQSRDQWVKEHLPEYYRSVADSTELLATRDASGKLRIVDRTNPAGILSRINAILTPINRKYTIPALNFGTANIDKLVCGGLCFLVPGGQGACKPLAVDMVMSVAPAWCNSVADNPAACNTNLKTYQRGFTVVGWLEFISKFDPGSGICKVAQQLQSLYNSTQGPGGQWLPQQGVSSYNRNSGKIISYTNSGIPKRRFVGGTKASSGAFEQLEDTAVEFMDYSFTLTDPPTFWVSCLPDDAISPSVFNLTIRSDVSLYRVATDSQVTPVLMVISGIDTLPLGQLALVDDTTATATVPLTALPNYDPNQSYSATLLTVGHDLFSNLGESTTETILATLSISGATISGPKSIRLIAPPDAVHQLVRIIIVPTIIPSGGAFAPVHGFQQQSGDSSVLVGQAIRLYPDGLVTARSCQLILPIDTTAVKSIANGKLMIARYDSTVMRWHLLPSIANFDSMTVSAPIQIFGIYGVVATTSSANICCIGRVGDANGSNEPTDEVTLGDIMLLVDAKFISGDCSKLPCLTEADVNQDGGANPTCEDHVTLGDIMTLVDFLFITGPETAILPDCL